MNIYRATNFRGRTQAGFSLIEMIGVMAIMAILAAIIAPNLLHSIERTAVKAEVDNLHALGGEMALYLRDNAVTPTYTIAPTPPVWPAQLAKYSSLNVNDILTNKRFGKRIYVLDAANQRAMLISSMRAGINLPTETQVFNSFQSVWDTPVNTVPVGAGWNNWGAGPPPVVDNIEYLVIERVSFASVYRTSLTSYAWSLNNSSLTDTVSCTVTWASGALPTSYTLAPSKSLDTITAPKLPPLMSGDKLAFFKSPLPTLLFSYVVSDSGKTFTYVSPSLWSAQ